MATRDQDQRRRENMRANGPVESFTVSEIGQRDGWICGICRDATRPVIAAAGTPRALSPSIDHIVALSAGGTQTKANVRIAHLWCNVERNSGSWHGPEYMQARLSQVLQGPPMPEEIYRQDRADLHAKVAATRARLLSGSTPTSLPAVMASWKQRPEWAERQEYMIMLQIAAGRVEPDARYGDPATRIADARRSFGETRWDESVARMASRRQRMRTQPDTWWRSSA